MVFFEKSAWCLNCLLLPLISWSAAVSNSPFQRLSEIKQGLLAHPGLKKTQKTPCYFWSGSQQNKTILQSNGDKLFGHLELSHLLLYCFIRGRFLDITYGVFILQAWSCQKKIMPQTGSIREILGWSPPGKSLILEDEGVYDGEWRTDNLNLL